MNRNREILLLFFSAFLILVPTDKSALGLVITEPGGVIMVDGYKNGIVLPFEMEIMDTFGSPMDFGLVQEGVFNTIHSIPAGTISPTSDTANFNAGQVVDFAIKRGNSIFSIADSIKDFGHLAFQVPVTGGTLNPSINTYVNNMTIDWIEGNLPISRLISNATSLKAGGNADGLAPGPISPVTLLFGVGLIGLIGIARRSFFTK